METLVLKKKCQFCGEEILLEAEVCKHCHRNQIDEKKYKKIVESLSNNNKLNIIPTVLVLIAYVDRRWWLMLIALFITIIVQYGIKDDLKKVSKLVLLEKYEKHLKSKLIYDIVYYILVIIAILAVIGYYSENGHI